ncbi:MAG TPA: hypothetical protein VFI31_09870 [Pirellulales bacterium]|nr:hypothetical protein [Pirellulales bacterium]
MNEPLVFVVPGDLHLTGPGKENHLAACGGNSITFLVDPSRRFTPVPRAFPEVTRTAFC